MELYAERGNYAFEGVPITAVGRCRKSAKRGKSQNHTVTRDNINSILVTISHPERKYADVVYEVLKDFAARKNGCIDHDQTV